MDFRHQAAPFSHHQSDQSTTSTLDPFWSQSLPHNATLFHPHSRVSYQGNALGLISDHREQNHTRDYMPSSGFVPSPAISHQDGVFVDYYHPSNAVVHPLSSVGFASNVDQQQTYTGNSNTFSGDQHWDFSSSNLNQDAVHRRSHSLQNHYPSSSHFMLIPNHLNVNESTSSSTSHLQGYQTSHLSQMEDHSQLHSQSGSNIQLGNQQYFAQLAQSGLVQSQTTKLTSNALTIQGGKQQNIHPDSNSRDTSSANANRHPIRISSPSRQKPLVSSCPPVERSQNKGIDTAKTVSSGSPAAESPAKHSLPGSHVTAERKTTAGRQQALTVTPRCAAPTQQSIIKVPATKRSSPEKKQTLACLFCRERKIACGRPPEGSADETCNQCARRNFKCQYPKESRRGQHKRHKKGHNVNNSK